MGEMVGKSGDSAADSLRRPIRQSLEPLARDISIRENQGAFFFAGNTDAAGPGGMFANVAQCSQARFFDADAPRLTVRSRRSKI
ncbi:MAG: hypothetical protein Kow0040_23760 [Thermogutta sp.]